MVILASSDAAVNRCFQASATTEHPGRTRAKGSSSPVEARSLPPNSRSRRRDERATRAAPVGGEAQPNPGAVARSRCVGADAAPLDKSAQPCQSDASRTLRSRARAKYLTSAIVDGLMRLGDRTPLRHAYRRTAGCAGNLIQEDGRVTGKYCGNRWCLSCNRIRTAKLMDAYLPEVRTWEDPHFVTLTIPNVTARELPGAVRSMIDAMPAIMRGVRRTDHLDVRAVRKLETTYNMRRGDFHPHLHLIVSSGAAGRAIVRRWLATFPDAVADAQDVRPCDIDGARELFKYFTKLVVKGLDGERTAPPPWVLDTMFKAVRGLRTFQPMGFVSRAAVTDDDAAIVLDAGTVSPSARPHGERVSWEWSDALTDWIDYATGEVLSGYEPSDRVRHLTTRIMADAHRSLDGPSP